MEMFKARCSQLSKIMSDPKAKKDKEAGNLSATCKSHVEQYLKEKLYGRYFEIDTLPIRKGNEKEIEATALVSKVLGAKLIRENKLLFNDYLTGHLDIDYADKKVIIDTKICKDFSTFPILDTEIELAYYWQGQGYMDLTGYDECWFAKCAINTPTHELERMEKAKWFQLIDIFGDESDDNFVMNHEALMRDLFMKHVVDNNITIKGYNLDVLGIPEIPIEKRVKIIKVQRCQEDIKLIEPRVKQIRQFLTNFKG